MNDQTMTPEERAANLKGMGSSRKRVEDVRFTQGKGNYVDDIKLDGMLFGDFVRSPYAHARVVSVNKEAALVCCRKCSASITGCSAVSARRA